jgi:fibronectin-binding autotransporter adhesin
MKTTSRPFSAGLAAAVLVFAASAPLRAADRFWRIETGGTFSATGSWTGGVVPGTLDTAAFGLSFGTPPLTTNFTYTVGFSANATNQAVRIIDDRVTFDLNTRLYTTTSATGNVIGTTPGFLGSLTITDGTWDLAENSELLIGGTAGATGSVVVTTLGILTDGVIIVGQAGAGAFSVINGGVANVDSVVIANAPGVAGTGNLSGNSFWTTTGSVVVGTSGNGTFNMNGGQMTCASAMLGSANGSTGTATLVDGLWQMGTGSMIVGNNGDGELNITSSARVLNGNASIGALASSGVVTVDGVNSEWISSGTFHVGNTGGGTLEAKNGGLVQVTGAAGSDIATLAGSTGQALVNTGARWTNTGPLRVGERGAGTLSVESGGLVENTNGTLGSFAGASSGAAVSGPGSRWLNSGFLRVGDLGTGTLTISAGGLVTNTIAVLGNTANSLGTAVVKDAGSRWTNSAFMLVGEDGDGSLTISARGVVESAVGMVGLEVNSSGDVLVTGPDSLWDNTADLGVGFAGNGVLEIASGGRVNNVDATIGAEATANGEVIVRDPGSLWNNTGLLTVGGSTVSVAPAATVTVTAGGEVRSAGGIIGKEQGSIASVKVSNPGSQWLNSADLLVGDGGVSELRVLNGSLVQNKNASLAHQDGSFGTATVDGQGSRWTNDGNLTIGHESIGELMISDGGMVQSLNSSIGGELGRGIGRVTVKDAGSQWTTLGRLGIVAFFPDFGQNRLNVLAGGTVNVGTDLTIINNSTVNLLGGTINIGGLFEFFSELDNVFNFTAGTLRFTGDVVLEDFRLTDILGAGHSIGELQHLAVVGTPTLEGLVRVDGGTFSAGSLPVGSPVDFNFGTFNLTGDNLVIGPAGLFGDTLSLSDRNVNVTNTATIQSGARLLMQGGAFSAGVLLNQGTIDIQNQSSLVSGGLLTNTGTIRGSGTILNPIQNSTAGKIQTTFGQRLEVGGAVNNAGQISLVGGQMQFNAAVTNAASTGTIAVRDAIIRFEGALTNHGSLAASFGTADILGDIVNSESTGRIVVSGNSDATFYGDLLNSGTVQVSAGSTAVWFGSVSGAGSFPGGGANFFEGDLAPGASPALITFGGDVSFGFLNTLTMELGGTARGSQYDSLSIAGSITAGGKLDVQLIAGFVPQQGQAFDLFDAGTVSGVFPFLTLPALPAGLTWDIGQLYSDGIIRVVFDGLTFSAWATASGLPGAQPNGDHDGDGNDNGTEFALGLFPPQPGTVEPTGGLFTYWDSERLRLLFTRPLDRTGVTLKVQASDDLITWTDVAISTDSAPFTGPGFVSEDRAHPVSEPGLVEVRDILNGATTPRRQMRVHLEITP